MWNHTALTPTRLAAFISRNVRPLVSSLLFRCTAALTELPISWHRGLSQTMKTSLPRLNALRRALASAEAKPRPNVRPNPSPSKEVVAPSDREPSPQDVPEEGRSTEENDGSEQDGMWENDSVGPADFPKPPSEIPGQKTLMSLLLEYVPFLVWQIRLRLRHVLTCIFQFRDPRPVGSSIDMLSDVAQDLELIHGDRKLEEQQMAQEDRNHRVHRKVCGIHDRPPTPHAKSRRSGRHQEMESE